MLCHRDNRASTKSSWSVSFSLSLSLSLGSMRLPKSKSKNPLLSFDSSPFDPSFNTLCYVITLGSQNAYAAPRRRCVAYHPTGISSDTTHTMPCHHRAFSFSWVLFDSNRYSSWVALMPHFITQTHFLPGDSYYPFISLSNLICIWAKGHFPAAWDLLTH